MKSHPAADLFPLLADDELRDLADDIMARGLTHPIWTVEREGETVILDGRNRFRACQMAGVAPLFRAYEGDDPIGFSLSENIKRRHLNAGQLGMLSLEAEKLYAAEAKARQVEFGRAATRTDLTLGADLPQGLEPPRKDADRAIAAGLVVCSDCGCVIDVDGSGVHRSSCPRVPNDRPVVSRPRAPRARDRAAKVTGASGRVVGQSKRVAEKAPELAEQVKAGTLAIDRADRIIRDREAEARRIAQAAEQRKHQEQGTRVELHTGDFRDVLADLSDVDAVITDPPYPREFLPLLADLAAWSDKVLAPDGILAVLFGQMYLPEVYRLLDGHRPYRWTMTYLTPGAGYSSPVARVQSNWKPVLVYGGGPRFADVLRSEAQDAGAKSLHEWGQDYGAFHTLVERLTKPGQTIADPFAGSGTTLLAAQALGRHAIGAELDPDHAATARRRLGI